MELFKLVGKIAIDNDEAKKVLKDTSDTAEQTADRIDGSGNSMTGTFKKIGAAVVTYLTVDSIIRFGSSCLTAAADAQAAESQFSQVFGNVESTARTKLQNISDTTGISENRIKGSFTQIAAFAKTTGMDTADAMGLSERAMLAVADSAAFYDRSIEDTTDSLQSFLKGNYENDAALGLSCTETTRNAMANKLYGKSFNELSESQKQLTLLAMVEEANKASGAMGQAARESDTWTNVLGNLKQAWTDILAGLGSAILPKAIQIVKGFAERLGNLADRIPDIVAWFEKYKGVLGIIAGVIGVVTAAVIAQNVVKAVQIAMNAAEATSLGALIAMKLASAAATLAALAPYLLITAAIAGVVAIVVVCWKKFEGFRNVVQAVASAVKDGFAKAIEFLKPYIKDIKEAIGELTSAVGDRLKQAFEWAKNAIKSFQTSSSPVINAIKTLFTTQFNAMKIVVTTVFKIIKTTISTALNVIKQIIKVATAIIKGDWKGAWDGIKNIFSTVWKGIKKVLSTGLNGAKSLVKNSLNGIKNIFGDIWDGIKTKVSNAIEKIKGMLKFKWKLPKPSIPDFDVKGGKAPWGFGGKGSLPKVTVKWHADAMDNPMLMTKPTIFGYNPTTGTYHGGGEAGSEMVGGTDTIMNMIASAVAGQNEALVCYLQKLVEILAVYFPQVIAGQERAVVLDTGATVGALAVPMDQALGKLSARKGRGR